jgi:hypothetical protein
MPPPVAMPPPIAIQQPVFYAPPPRTGVRKIRKRNGFGIGARVVAIGFGLLILFGIIGAIDNAVSSNSTSKISPISIPSIRITFPNLVPHQPPPHKTAKTPPHAVNVNALSDLITLSVSNELYRAEHGSYTNRVSALSGQQFQINPQGDYQIGLGGSGYCMVGRDSLTSWRVYDSFNPTSIASTYGTKAKAMLACSQHVRWG